MSKERRVSVRNDCRTFQMDDENERERGSRRTPADTVILYQCPTVRSYASSPQHASLPHERLQEKVAIPRHFPLRSAVARHSTLEQHAPSTAGERMVKEGDAANLVPIAERSGSQFRASMACRRQALVRSELGYSRAGAMSRF